MPQVWLIRTDAPRIRPFRGERAAGPCQPPYRRSTIKVYQNSTIL